MLVNAIAITVLALCVALAVAYMVKRHRIAKAMGRPACCGCPLKGCRCNHCK